MLQVLRAISAAIAATFTVAAAHAQVYPAKALGQSVVIENLPSASGVKLD